MHFSNCTRKKTRWQIAKMQSTKHQELPRNTIALDASAMYSYYYFVVSGTSGTNGTNDQQKAQNPI